MSKDIPGVEFVGDGPVLVDVCQDFLEEIQTEIGVGAQLVPKGPNHAVQDSVEVVFVQGEKGPKVEFDERFEETEEVGPDLGETVEVGSYQWEA